MDENYKINLSECPNEEYRNAYNLLRHVIRVSKDVTMNPHFIFFGPRYDSGRTIAASSNASVFEASPAKEIKVGDFSFNSKRKSFIKALSLNSSSEPFKSLYSEVDITITKLQVEFFLLEIALQQIFVATELSSHIPSTFKVVNLDMANNRFKELLKSKVIDYDFINSYRQATMQRRDACSGSYNAADSVFGHLWRYCSENIIPFKPKNDSPKVPKVETPLSSVPLKKVIHDETKKLDIPSENEGPAIKLSQKRNTKPVSEHEMLKNRIKSNCRLFGGSRLKNRCWYGINYAEWEKEIMAKISAATQVSPEILWPHLGNDPKLKPKFPKGGERVVMIGNPTGMAHFIDQQIERQKSMRDWIKHNRLAEAYGGAVQSFEQFSHAMKQRTTDPAALKEFETKVNTPKENKMDANKMNITKEIVTDNIKLGAKIALGNKVIEALTKVIKENTKIKLPLLGKIAIVDESAEALVKYAAGTIIVHLAEHSNNDKLKAIADCVSLSMSINLVEQGIDIVEHLISNIGIEDLLKKIS